VDGPANASHSFAKGCSLSAIQTGKKRCQMKCSRGSQENRVEIEKLNAPSLLGGLKVRSLARRGNVKRDEENDRIDSEPILWMFKTVSGRWFQKKHNGVGWLVCSD